MGAREVEAIVIGAGFAGLGTARELRRRGVDVAVLEARDRVAEPWRARYESLRLNTLGWQSAAPGRRFPRGTGPFPSRDVVVAYLEEYARKERIPIAFGIEARRIERDRGRWIVHTSKDDFVAPVVVVATGFDREPDLPEWPGRESFTGELIHASEYRNPDPYRGKDVLVVSAGNTGSEISLELARNDVNRVWTAMRSAPNIVPRWMGRVPGPYLGMGLTALPLPVLDRMAGFAQRLMFGDLNSFGIPAPTYGLGTNVLERLRAPVVDDGFVRAVKNGEIEIVAALASFEADDAVLADGRRLQPDAVIAATGYRRALDELVGDLGLLRPDGRPTHNAVPGPPDAPGIWFVGYDTLVQGQLPLTRRHAKRVARAATRWLRQGRSGILATRRLSSASDRGRSTRRVA